MTSKILQKLETEEIVRSCEPDSSHNLNSQKHVEVSGQSNEQKVSVIADGLEAVTETIVTLTVQDKDIEWYISEGLIKDDRKVGRYRVTYFDSDKQKRKDFQYNKNPETAAKNAIEWYLKHNVK